MNRPPEICDTVQLDAGVINFNLRGKLVPAEVVAVYPPTPHSRRNPRARMILVEVTHANGARLQHAVPIRRVRRS